MASQAALAGEIEVEAFRRLYPLQFYERHLNDNVRPDARPLGRARATSLALGTVLTADGSAMAKIGHTTMLAGVKLEVMTPAAESPDEGRIAVGFQMPPICSPDVRPGRPVDIAAVISEQLSNVLARSNKHWEGSKESELQTSRCLKDPELHFQHVYCEFNTLVDGLSEKALGCDEDSLLYKEQREDVIVNVDVIPLCD